MSTYIDSTRPPVEGELGWQPDHVWIEFTENRLRWLYGPNHKAERAALTQADLTAWNRLGSSRSAA